MSEVFEMGVFKNCKSPGESRGLFFTQIDFQPGITLVANGPFLPSSISNSDFWPNISLFYTIIIMFYAIIIKFSTTGFNFLDFTSII